MKRLLLLLLLACRTQPASDELVIGEVGSLTGSEATFGTSTHDGIRLALDGATVKGKKLRLRTYDDQGKSDEAAAAITKLITQDKVIAVIGEVSSSRSIAMAPIAQRNHVPMIAPAATAPKVTQMGDYIFRVCFIDPFQGAAMAKLAVSRFSAKTAAILRDNKSDYSMGLGDAFKTSFAGAIVAEEMYSAGDVHFRAQLTAIKAKSPDVLFVPGYYTDGGLIIRQARELGLKMPILGGDGWDSAKLIEIGGAAAEGVYYSNNFSEDLEAGKPFVAAFKKRFGYTPDGNAALGYEAALVLLDALNRSTSFTGEALRDALAATRDVSGVTSKITIDSQRNAQKSLVVLEVNGGKLRLVTTVTPTD